MLMVARRGQGTEMLPLWTDECAGTATCVSDVADPSLARFCESVEAGHSSHDDATSVAGKLGIRAPSLRMDSQAKYATVARGDAQIYLRMPTRADYREKIWDHAAGMIVVTEAGGRVTDVHGRELDFGCGRRLENNQGIVATNGSIHDRVVAVVGEVLGAG